MKRVDRRPPLGRSAAPILAIGDYIGGLPGWVTDEYNRAEREFGDGVCDLLLSISSDVNGVIAAAQAVIKVLAATSTPHFGDGG